jgi:nitrogen fixation protein FixH
MKAHVVLVTLLIGWPLAGTALLRGDGFGPSKPAVRETAAAGTEAKRAPNERAESGRLFLKIHKDGRVELAPSASGETQLVCAKDLPEGAWVVRCDDIHVTAAKSSQGKDYVQIKCRGNVAVEGSKFTARTDQMRYEVSRDQEIRVQMDGVKKADESPKNGQ